MDPRELVTYIESKGKYLVMKKDGATFTFDSKVKFDNFLYANNYRVNK